ncbi:MAG: hypothetical protein WHU94_16025 [Thermogemmata sp.]
MPDLWSLLKVMRERGLSSWAAELVSGICDKFAADIPLNSSRDLVWFSVLFDLDRQLATRKLQEYLGRCSYLARDELVAGCLALAKNPKEVQKYGYTFSSESIQFVAESLLKARWSWKRAINQHLSDEARRLAEAQASKGSLRYGVGCLGAILFFIVGVAYLGGKASLAERCLGVVLFFIVGRQALLEIGVTENNVVLAYCAFWMFVGWWILAIIWKRIHIQTAVKTHLAQLQEREEQMWSRLEAEARNLTGVMRGVGLDSVSPMEPFSVGSSETLGSRPVRLKALTGYALLAVLVTVGLLQLARNRAFRSPSPTRVAMNEGSRAAATEAVKGCPEADWLLQLLPGGTVPIAGNCPPRRFVDSGACPFEGCVYREWVATKDTDAFADWQTYSLSTRRIFQVREGRKVEALTGVVVIERPGVVLVKRGLSLRDVKLLPGQIFYVLTTRGEGFAKVMFQNRLIDNVNLNDYKNEFFQFLAPPKTVWWVQIRDEQGRVGWIKDADNFKNKDVFE